MAHNRVDFRLVCRRLRQKLLEAPTDVHQNRIDAKNVTFINQRVTSKKKINQNDVNKNSDGIVTVATE